MIMICSDWALFVWISIIIYQVSWIYLWWKSIWLPINFNVTHCSSSWIGVYLLLFQTRCLMLVVQHIMLLKRSTDHCSGRKCGCWDKYATNWTTSYDVRSALLVWNRCWLIWLGQRLQIGIIEIYTILSLGNISWFETQLVLRSLFERRDCILKAGWYLSFLIDFFLATECDCTVKILFQCSK